MINLEAGPPPIPPTLVDVTPTTYIAANITTKAGNRTIEGVLHPQLFKPGSVVSIHNLDGSGWIGEITQIGSSNLTFDNPTTIDINAGASISELVSVVDSIINFLLDKIVYQSGFQTTAQSPLIYKISQNTRSVSIVTTSDYANITVVGVQSGITYNFTGTQNGNRTPHLMNFLVQPGADSQINFQFSAGTNNGTLWIIATNDILFGASQLVDFTGLGIDTSDFSVGSAFGPLLGVAQKALAYDIVGTSTPAGGVAPSIVFPATPGKTYTLARLGADLRSDAGVADGAYVQILDGATLLWNRLISVPATARAIDHMTEFDLAIKGTVGNSMTVKFASIGAGSTGVLSAATYLR